MKTRLQFANREEFRVWLSDSCESSDGVWLVFCKKAESNTLKASEALEEALCFGWIDGQMQRVDEDTYIKYFCCRRENSKWSTKNKTLVEQLEKEGRLSDFGRKKVMEAKNNGQWNAKKQDVITDEQIQALTDLLQEYQPAYINFLAMSPSVKKTYTRAYFDAKTQQGRLQRLNWIVQRLTKNLKPM